MKHRRGIDLIPDRFATSDAAISVARFAPEGNYHSVTFEMIPDWWVLGAICHACGSYGRVDRRGIQRKHGRKALLSIVGERLKCTGCDVRGQSMFILYGRWER